MSIVLQGDGVVSQHGQMIVLHPPKTGGTYFHQVAVCCCEKVTDVSPLHGSAVETIESRLAIDVTRDFSVACLVRHPAAWLASAWNFFQQVLDQCGVIPSDGIPFHAEFHAAMTAETLDQCFAAACDTKLPLRMFTDYLARGPRIIRIEEGLFGFRNVITLSDAAYAVSPCNVRQSGKNPSTKNLLNLRDTNRPLYTRLGY